MENKADMPNWNRFVNDVLSGRYKGSENQQNEDSVQYRQNTVPDKAGAGADKENTMQS